MSKIPPELIKKFNLKKTGIQNGQSFMNDCATYLWPNLVKGWKSYLMEGDLQGHPLEDGKVLLLVTKPGHVKQITWPILLLYNNLHGTVKSIVNHQIVNP